MVGGSSAVALAAALAPRSSADEVGVHHAAAFCAHTNEGGEAGWVVRQPPAGGERAGGAARARRTAGDAASPQRRGRRDDARTTTRILATGSQRAFEGLALEWVGFTCFSA